MSKVWFIADAGSGIGAGAAKAARRRVIARSPPTRRALGRRTPRELSNSTDGSS